MALDSTDRRDFVVKINGEESGAVGATGSSSNADGGNFWRESSYDFWDGEKGKNDDVGGDSFHFRQQRERSEDMSDPPSKQKASCGEISLDIDLNTADTLPAISESSSPYTAKGKADAVRRRQNRISLGESSDEESRRHYKANRDEAEVVKHSINKPFLRRNQTKSRLMDPPTPTHPAIDKTEMRSGRKSGFLGKNSKPGTPSRTGILEEDEEEDPFLDEDLPDVFKRDKLSIWVLLEWISLVLIVTSLVCSLTVHSLRRKTWWKLDLWKWEVTVLVLICGRLVSSWIVRILVFSAEKNFVLRKRVLYFVYGVRKSVQNTLWLGLVLLAWHFLFDKKVERETRTTAIRYVTRVLVCLLVAVIIWLIKTLLVKVLASSFHMSTYFDRIQESLFTQYVIETLSGPPLMEIQRMEEEEQKVTDDVKSLEKLAGAKLPPALKATVRSFMKAGKGPRLSRIGSDKEDDSEGIRIDQLQRMNTDNVSAWNMTKLMNIIRKGALSTLDEHMQDTVEESEHATQIRSECEAKIAAKKIFHNVTEPGSRYIHLDDFLRFLSEEESERAMALFEGASETNRISKSCLKNWVVKAFRERRALALTLNDTKTAVNRLHRIINVLISIIIIIIWLLILGIATTKFLLVLSSQLLLVAFIFGNSCKTIFEAIIFLFVMHPFDVGDRCEIDGVQLVVEEMNILTTVFLRYDNQKIIYPNSVLGTKPIANYFRSPDMGDAIEFSVHIATPPEKIAAIKQRIISYIDIKKDHWYPAPMIVFLNMDDLKSVKIAVWLTHRMNFQDMGERFIRRSQLLEEVGKACRELDIEYRLHPQGIHIRSFPPPVTPGTSDRLPPACLHQRGA
ncbi:Mechanosensitive ion channel protein 5 [Raphanus sativus]|uniref:Mechanosensitive ion channel protein n=1 Tax=Raphanus sativus TaxID=3726 RepID=A0A9W3CM65_RAPSA|nr:mechanosensitive ion channel protein 5-like [Raphanus sativus]XP_056852727.1 mechanosensitive ion channel protein 5-like [Raphanus sativus]KAJ4872438.1 Mechanosensitive ion channel protein 5 [Raphanus sativus]KAJ4874004.1 Mechanosensitive ion channel protein 5 [Raphanus sativus]